MGSNPLQGAGSTYACNTSFQHDVRDSASLKQWFLQTNAVILFKPSVLVTAQASLSASKLTCRRGFTVSRLK